MARRGTEGRNTERRGAEGASGTPATLALTRADVAFTVHGYAHDRAAESYGAEAAEALGAAPERVLKTLLARADGTLTVAVLPVSAQLDLKALAGAVRAKRAALAERADAERATGYVIGGISPLGQRKQLSTVLESSALLHDTVLISAGRRGLEIELAPADLRALTRAHTADIARDVAG